MLRPRALKQLILLAAVLVAAAISYIGREPSTAPAPGQQGPTVEGRTQAPPDDQALREAIDRRQRDVLVQGHGVVIKVLPDDRQGSRHQRILLRLPMGDTLLIAHNIDLAPRVPGLERGDTVEFQGEYVWNDQGGVLHWTHHDPTRRHPGGWLRHAGRTHE